MSWPVVLIAATLGVAPVAHEHPVYSAESCPITRPSLPFVPPAPYPIVPSGEGFWHGTAAFWTLLRVDGYWSLSEGAGPFTQKIFWWRPGFNGSVENFSDLTVTLRNLATGELTIATRKATNASHKMFGGSVMLTGIRIPSYGCWEVTGEHRGHEVSFIVWVAP